MGVYAESYETELGIRTSDESSSLYYLIPIFDRAGDGKIRYLITFHAEPEDFDTLDKIVAQTWSDEPITTRLTVDDGYIGLLPDKFKQYFLEWAHDDAFYENGSSLIGAKNIKFLGQMMKLPSKPGLSHFIHITGMILQSNQALTSHGGSAQRAYTGNDRPDTVDSLQSPDRRF